MQQQQLDFSYLQHNLYGCEKELEQLKEAYHRRLQPNPNNEFILISGKSGTGKTSLATTIREDVVHAQNGYFIVGTYDQFQRPEPYSTIVSAFKDFVHMVIENEVENVKQLKEDIISSVGAENIGILVGMIPAVGQLLDSSGGTSSLGAEAHTRIKTTFLNFVRGICSPERPIVLLMDDLQWADSTSLDLLETLVADNKSQGLVILGVCRSNEVTCTHSFSAMLRNLEDEKNTLVTHIQVENLTFETTNALVADLLKLSKETCLPFTEAVYSKTTGNVYFLLQLMQSLCEDGILKFKESKNSLGNQQTGGCWVWDQNDLDDYQKGQDIINLVSNKIKRLPSSTQLVLKAAACMGVEFEEYILSTVLIENFDIANDLAIAIEAGLVISKKNGQHNAYAFSHDRIEQAAYNLIDEDHKERMHLFIGETLMDNLSSEDMEMYLFLVVNQLSRGASLLKNQEEKYSLANLCLIAGEKSLSSGDFKTATKFFWRGIALLGHNKNQHWKEQYFLSLNLYNPVAEAEYCVPNYSKMDVAIDEVLMRAHFFRDKIRAYATQISAFGTRDRMCTGIDVGLSVLDGLGQPFPRKLNKAKTIMDIAKTEMMLRGKTNRYIQYLPDCTSPEIVEAMSILNIISTFAFVDRKKLFPFIACRLVQLSLKYGLCAISSYGFVLYGLVCCKLGSFENGYRWGRLGLSILERYNTTEKKWTPRVYGVFYGLIACRKQSMHTLLDKVRHGYQDGLESGDVEFAMVGMTIYGKIAFFIGTPLPRLEQELIAHSEKIKCFKGGPIHTDILLLHQTVHNLMGHNATTDNQTTIAGAIFDQDKIFDAGIDKRSASLEINLMVYRMILAYHLNDIELAIEMAEKSRVVDSTQIIASTQYFYDGMTAFAAASNHERSIRRNRRKHISMARKTMNKMEKLSISCPKNFLHKWLLMKAEYASLKKGKSDEAMECYEYAIDKARDVGFLQDEAMACERAGLYILLRHNNKSNVQTTLAGSYLNKAIGLYQKWGATAKVDQIIAQHKNICLEKPG